ncbi:MAG: hypothetical protein ABIN58_10345 [candidate division WOR-3 bacterium]
MIASIAFIVGGILGYITAIRNIRVRTIITMKGAILPGGKDVKAIAEACENTAKYILDSDSGKTFMAVMLSRALDEDSKGRMEMVKDIIMLGGSNGK